MAARGLERRLQRAAAAGETNAVEALIRDGADPGCQVCRFFVSVRNLLGHFPEVMWVWCPSMSPPRADDGRWRPASLRALRVAGPKGGHPADAGLRAWFCRRRASSPRRRSPVV